MGIKLGKCMKCGEAMVLPELYKEYVSTVKSTASLSGAEFMDENFPSSRWFFKYTTEYENAYLGFN